MKGNWDVSGTWPAVCDCFVAALEMFICSGKKCKLFVSAPILEQYESLETILWQNPEAQHVNTKSHHFLWPWPISTELPSSQPPFPKNCISVYWFKPACWFIADVDTVFWNARCKWIFGALTDPKIGHSITVPCPLSAWTGHHDFPPLTHASAWTCSDQKSIRT